MRTIAGLCAGLLAGVLVVPMAETARASENVAHAPFAQWADVPDQGQFIVGLNYQRSEAYHIWANNTYHNITVMSGGESYGIDINQGYVTLQYGLTEQWAADLSLGATTVGWRYFSQGKITSTVGVMDIPFGVRYQAFHENETNCCWVPTLTFRAGGVLPGTYSQNIAFSPGDRSAAIEPEVLLRKHFGWPGLGVYGDALFRWNHTTHNDHYIAATGLFQQIGGWELNLGYKRLGTPQGQDIVLDTATQTIFYPRMVRENSDSTEAGFSYTTAKRHIQYGFYTRTVWSGANTDGKFWLGGYINVPFGGK